MWIFVSKMDLPGSNREKLLQQLKELAEIDQGMKSGKLDATDSVELFLLRNLHER